MSKATDSLEADRAELLKLCSGLTEADWRAESGCEGWTVQDVVSHMAALYWLVVDRSKLPDVGDLPTERAQDVYVEQRRAMTAEQVLADYESVSAAALPALAGLDGQTFELPLGDLGTYQAGVVPTAYSFDHYVHIRMDLFEPRGPLAGPRPPSDDLRLVPTLDWVQAALPQQSAAAIAELPGSIEFAITGAGTRTLTVGSGAPLGRVTTDSDAFVRAITGRSDWSSAVIETSAEGLTPELLTPELLTQLKVF